MKRIRAICSALLLAVVLAAAPATAGPPSPWPRFEAVEIDRSLTVGYAVLLHDITGDHRPDIIVVDSRRLIYFENPSWRLRTILPEGSTKPDNVCIAPLDVDGDRWPDLVLGAGWRGFNTRDPGTLQWLRNPGKPGGQWSLHPIDRFISIHRIRVGDIDGDGKAELVSAPLLGERTTRRNNFMERPVPLVYYEPAGTRPWPRKVIDDRNLHVMHNAWIDDLDGNGRPEVLTASYEGVYSYEYRDGKWHRYRIGEGDQSNPTRERGCSEVKTGRLKDGRRIVATIEPWHGDKVVVYVQDREKIRRFRRVVLDRRLRQGHAVWCVDFDGDGNDEIVAGFRAPYSDEVPFGLRLYRAADEAATQWDVMELDRGGMACEDVGVADLDGDGRPDIVAVGRATRNVKIYWNRGE